MKGTGLELAIESRPFGERSCAVVVARGEIDLSTAPELKKALGSEQCDAADVVVVDLSKVPFVDSSGLAALLSASRDLDAFGLALDSQSAVHRLFELVEVDDQLRLFGSLDEALEELAGELR